MAASTVNTSRELGGVFGVAVLGAVVNAQLTSGLTEKLVKLDIPLSSATIVIQFVTTGGNITSAENSHREGAREARSPRCSSPPRTRPATASISRSRSPAGSSSRPRRRGLRRAA